MTRPYPVPVEGGGTAWWWDAPCGATYDLTYVVGMVPHVLGMTDTEWADLEAKVEAGAGHPSPIVVSYSSRASSRPLA